MSSYKELNNLISQSGKFFNKKYKNLSAAEQKELSNLSYNIKITTRRFTQEGNSKAACKTESC